MDDREALRLLGLDGPADATEVRRAYRRLARQLHPDAGGDADRFHAVQLAFETVRDGTDARTGAGAPQVHVAGVEDRWWETPAAWHEGPVDITDVRLDETPTGRATRASVDLVASALLVERGAPPPVRCVLLHSRAPGSRLHRFVSLLEPDLLTTLRAAPATSGQRVGHDVRLELRAPAGRGRRHAGEVTPPAGWTRRRGADTVRIGRDVRPCRDPVETAVRVARELEHLTTTIAWPLEDWFVLRSAAERPT